MPGPSSEPRTYGRICLRHGQRFEERVGAFMGLDEGLEPPAQRGVPGASLAQVVFPLRADRPLPGLAEKDLFRVFSRFHR